MKKKFAFTVAEVLLTLVIIGTISTIGLSMFRQYDKGIRYIYSNVYHTLDRAVYNGVNFSDVPSPFNAVEVDEETGADVEVSPEEAAERLCYMIAQYINTFSVSCRTDNLADDSGTNLNDPQIIGSNGMRYYITRRLPDSKTDDEPFFFLVYVDINGETVPNSLHYEPGSDDNRHRTVDPDIFAFAIVPVEGARVCPLGPPEIDGRYMLTRIQYHDGTSDDDEDAELIRFSTVSIPYYMSKAEAWGYYLPESKVTGGVVSDTAYTDNPYTYNGYVRSKLPAENAIYAFLGGASIPQIDSDDVSLRSEDPPEGFGCIRLSDECIIIIDRYLY